MRLYNKHEWRVAGLLAVSYLALSLLTASYFPAAGLYPALPVALCALYFGGLRLFPVVYATAFVSAILAESTPLLLGILPVAATLQAVAGAYALRAYHLDPLFRRYRDTTYLVATVAAVSLVGPMLLALAAAVAGEPYPLAGFGRAYTASLFCFLVLTPFILRWCAKPRFSRSPVEAAETAGAFALLAGVDFMLFINGAQTAAGIPLMYFLSVPLFL